MAHRLSASQSIKWTTKKVSCPFLRPPSLSFWRNQQKYNYEGELNWGLSASQGWKEGFNKAQRERVCLTDCGKSCVFCRWQWCTFTFTFIYTQAYKHSFLVIFLNNFMGKTCNYNLHKRKVMYFVTSSERNKLSIRNITVKQDNNWLFNKHSISRRFAMSNHSFF